MTDLPLVAYPNRGQQCDAPAVWPPAEVRAWANAGARWVGGCGGVGPDGIRAVRAALTPTA